MQNWLRHSPSKIKNRCKRFSCLPTREKMPERVKISNRLEVTMFINYIYRSTPKYFHIVVNISNLTFVFISFRISIQPADGTRPVQFLVKLSAQLFLWKLSMRCYVLHTNQAKKTTMKMKLSIEKSHTFSSDK